MALNEDQVKLMNYYQMDEFKQKLIENNRPKDEKDMVDAYLSDFLKYAKKLGENVKEHPYAIAFMFFNKGYDSAPPTTRGICDLSRMTLSNMIPLDALLTRILYDMGVKMGMYFDMLEVYKIDEELDAIKEEDDKDELYDLIIHFFKTHVNKNVDYEKDFCMLLNDDSINTLRNAIDKFEQIMGIFRNNNIETDKLLFNMVITKTYNFDMEFMTPVQATNHAAFIDSLYRYPKQYMEDLDTIEVTKQDDNHHTHIEKVPVYKKVKNLCEDHYLAIVTKE